MCFEVTCQVKISFNPPVEERRAIQKQRMIAEYMIKVGKANIDGFTLSENGNNAARKADGDDDLIEIDGEIYKIN
jgi:hypothetical protein